MRWDGGVTTDQFVGRVEQRRLQVAAVAGAHDPLALVGHHGIDDLRPHELVVVRRLGNPAIGSEVERVVDGFHRMLRTVGSVHDDTHRRLSRKSHQEQPRFMASVGLGLPAVTQKGS